MKHRLKLTATCLLCCLTPGCKSMQGLQQMLAGTEKPSVRVVGARLENLTMDAVAMTFDLEVSNPYDVPLPLLDLDYTLASAGTQFLSGKGQATGSIPAGGAKVIPVTADVPFAGLLSVLKTVRPGQVVPYEAKIGLAVDAPVVGRLTLPVTRQGELPVPTVPKVEVKRFAVDTLSLQEVAMTLDLDIQNTNRFDIGLNQLQYALSLAGSQVADTRVESDTDFKAGATQSLHVPVRFSPASVGIALLNVLRGEAADYTLGGTMRLDTPFGPLNAPFERSGRAPIGR